MNEAKLVKSRLEAIKESVSDILRNIEYLGTEIGSLHSTSMQLDGTYKYSYLDRSFSSTMYLEYAKMLEYISFFADELYSLQGKCDNIISNNEMKDVK